MASTFHYNLCDEHETTTLQKLLNHKKRFHGSDPNFHVICGVNGRCKTYRKFVSYRNHLIRKHNITRQNNCEANIDNGELLDEEDDPLFDPEQEELDRSLNEEDIRRLNALGLLKFKEMGRVPQTVVNTFVESSTQIVQNSIDLLRSGVLEKLFASGVDDTTINDVRELFKDGFIRHPFQGIDKEPLQYQYYKENFSLVVSLLKPHNLT